LREISRSSFARIAYVGMILGLILTVLVTVPFALGDGSSG
jgi:hypothetical protein